MITDPSRPLSRSRLVDDPDHREELVADEEAWLHVQPFDAEFLCQVDPDHGDAIGAIDVALVEPSPGGDVSRNASSRPAEAASTGTECSYSPLGSTKSTVRT